MSITDTVACFSCPLRTLCCLFLISITDTVAWFSSPLDLANWTKSALLGLKGGSNEIFSYLMVFREVISFTYQKFLLGDRVPLRGWKLGHALLCLRNLWMLKESPIPSLRIGKWPLEDSSTSTARIPTYCWKTPPTSEATTERLYEQF